MYLIVGLGNPEEEYNYTRHNMGFHAINKLSESLKIEIKKNKFDGLYGIGEYFGEKIILLKPQTYMNLSGKSVIQFKNFYKIPNENIVVIYDDMDIDPQIIKIRKKGGSGSHNGMKSVVECLNTEDFPRIRIGIGRAETEEKINFVIGSVTKEEMKKLDTGAEKAAEAIEELLKNGIDSAMNKYN